MRDIKLIDVKTKRASRKNNNYKNNNDNQLIHSFFNFDKKKQKIKKFREH